MSTKFLSPGWRMPRNANQNKQANYSLQRTGVNQYMQADNISFDSGPSFTISCWVFKADIDASGLYAFYGTEYYGNSTGGFVIYYGSGGVTFYSSLPGSGSYFSFSTANNLLVDNIWQQVIIRYNYGVDYRIYINNVLRAVNTTNNSATWPEQNIRLFRHYSNDGYDHDGALSDWCFFNYALSDTATSVGDTATGQIAQLYGDGSSLPNPMALPNPPIAYYPLGESAGGFVGGSGTWLTENNAIGDYVFDFDGLAEITTGGISGISSNTTVSFWFNNSTAAGGQAPLIASLNYTSTTYENFAFRLQTNNIIQAVLAKSGNYEILQTSAIIDNAWYFVALTTSTSGSSVTATLYLNGTQVATNSGTDFSNLNDLQNGLTIGHWIGPSNQNNFNGTISNVQIFNTALSGPEVETLYNYGSPIKTLANIPQNSNLKAWYKLDASEVYNSSTTEWSIDNNQNPSAYPSSLDFDASSGDYIDCGQNTNLDTGDLSVSIWINKDSAGSGTQYIFNNNNGSSIAGFAILMNSINRVFLYRNTGTYSTNTGYTDVGFTTDTWHHLCFTYNDTTKSFVAYFNGVSFHTSTATSSSGGASQNIIIGTNSSLSGNNFDGQLSNASIWNTELTSAQVTEIYNNGTPSNLSSHSATSNLISWWKLNNTTTGIEDSKGSNDGTNNGAIEYPGFVNVLAGDSSGMSQANLVQSDLQTVAPYSKYALDFDSASSDAITLGNTIGNGFTQITCSIWANISTSGLTQSSYRNFLVKFPGGSGSATPFELRSAPGNRTDSYNNKLFFRVNTNTGGYGFTDTGFEFTEANKWHHLVGTYDGSNVKLFVDGVEYYSISASGTLNSNNNNATIGYYGSTGNFNGKLSNASIWNTALTSAQVTEIYNEGLPGNLNSHSAYSNLVSWWQLGENSSFDGNDWIVADEKGTNNGTSTGMSVGALVNGVGTTANGLSSGMSEGNLVGDAPYSTANALSTNMVVTSRVSGSGNTP